MVNAMNHGPRLRSGHVARQEKQVNVSGEDRRLRSGIRMGPLESRLVDPIRTSRPTPSHDSLKKKKKKKGHSGKTANDTLARPGFGCQIRAPSSAK